MVRAALHGTYALTEDILRWSAREGMEDSSTKLANNWANVTVALRDYDLVGDTV